MKDNEKSFITLFVTLLLLSVFWWFLTTYDINRWGVGSLGDLNRSKRLSDPVVKEYEGYLLKNSGYIDADSISHNKGQVLASNNPYSSKWRPLVKKHFPQSEVDYALDIIHCESRGNPKAHNLDYNTKDNSYGLFQINLWGELKYHRPSPQELVDPETNIKFAREIWDKYGWKAWGCN